MEKIGVNKMKLYKILFVIAFSLLLSTLGYAKDGYLVILKSFSAPTLKQGQAIEKQFAQLKRQGFSPYFVKTDNYPPLREGLWAMVLGEFDKQSATAKQTQVKRWISDAYIRKVNLPELKPIDNEFVYTETYFNVDNCFTIWEAPEQEGSGSDYCVGKQGFHVDTLYGDSRAYINISGEEFQGENWMGSEGFPYFHPAYPLRWIYRNDNPQRPIAVSLAISTSDIDGNHHTDRYLIKINDKKFTPVKQKFPVKGELDSIAQYLKNSP